MSKEDLVANLPDSSTGNGAKTRDIKLKFKFSGSTYILVISINENNPDSQKLTALVTEDWVNKILAKKSMQLLDCEGKGLEVVVGKEGNHNQVGFLNDKDFNKELNYEVHGLDILEAFTRGAKKCKTQLQIFSSFEDAE